MIKSNMDYFKSYSGNLERLESGELTISQKKFYVNDKEVFKHFLNEANSLGLNISENIVHLRATTPSREYKLIDYYTLIKSILFLIKWD